MNARGVGAVCLLLLGMAAFAAGQQGAQDDEIIRLERQIREQEDRVDDLDRHFKKAIDQNKPDEAERYRRLWREAGNDLEEMRRKLERLKQPVRKPGPPSRVSDAFSRVEGGAEFLWTHFDKSLDLSNGEGMGAQIGIPDLVAFVYRRWDSTDDRIDDDATMTQYLVSFAPKLKIDSVGASNMTLAVGLGLFHIGSHGAGGDSDSGFVASVEPQYIFNVTDNIRLTAGAPLDLLRTSFNTDHTHTQADVSVTVGLAVHF